MKRTLLITNANSGSAGAVNDEELLQSLGAGEFDVTDRIELPDGNLPSLAAVEKLGIEVVAILSGDGTISSLCAKLSGWGGAILVLPGGTMNLLSRRLHGEQTLAEMLPRLSSLSDNAEPVPVILLERQEIYTGLTVGPSAKWGEVREGIRQGDVSTLTEAVPAAWSETLAPDGVWIEGRDRETYAGIFIEPVDAATLSVIAFRANNVGDIVGHGLAWLRRDFREGPRDELGSMPRVIITGDDAVTHVLIDGEHNEHALPLSCSAAMSSVSFLRLAA